MFKSKSYKQVGAWCTYLYKIEGVDSNGIYSSKQAAWDRDTQEQSKQVCPAPLLGKISFHVGGLHTGKKKENWQELLKIWENKTEEFLPACKFNISKYCIGHNHLIHTPWL